MLVLAGMELIPGVRACCGSVSNTGMFLLLLCGAHTAPRAALLLTTPQQSPSSSQLEKQIRQGESELT